MYVLLISVSFMFLNVMKSSEDICSFNFNSPILFSHGRCGGEWCGGRVKRPAQPLPQEPQVWSVDTSNTIYTLSTHYLHYLYRYFMPPPREPSYNYGPSMLQKKSKEPFINDSTNIFILRNSFKIILIFHWRLYGWNLRKRVVSSSPGWGELELG